MNSECHWTHHCNSIMLSHAKGITSWHLFHDESGRPSAHISTHVVAAAVETSTIIPLRLQCLATHVPINLSSINCFTCVYRCNRTHINQTHRCKRVTPDKSFYSTFWRLKVPALLFQGRPCPDWVGGGAGASATTLPDNKFSSNV